MTFWPYFRSIANSKYDFDYILDYVKVLSIIKSHKQKKVFVTIGDYFGRTRTFACDYW